MYAENCHFSLSVFCTEVPYRNVLPDFEGTRHFRFTETEVTEIIDALCGLNQFSTEQKHVISRQYTDSPSASLLFVIIKNLLEKRPIVNNKIMEEAKISEAPEGKTQINNGNFTHLNRYLSILATKVKEMVVQFENLQKRNHSTIQEEQQKLPNTHRKILQKRKYDYLNRSLERISGNLRLMSVSKRKNKRITEIVNAVNALSKQFEKCSTEFIKVSQSNFDQRRVFEKEKYSYVEWIKEVLSSVHGQEFLDRVCVIKTIDRFFKNMFLLLD